MREKQEQVASQILSEEERPLLMACAGHAFALAFLKPGWGKDRRHYPRLDLVISND